jgi:hypothetical protein
MSHRATARAGWRERPRVRRGMAVLSFGILLAITFWQITEPRLRIATGLILLLFLWLTLRHTPAAAPVPGSQNADRPGGEPANAAAPEGSVVGFGPM